MMTKRELILYVLAAGLAALAGCSGSDEPDLTQRIHELEVENQILRHRLAKLTAELGPLQERLQAVDQDNLRLNRTLTQLEQDLRARLQEMVQQESSGGRGRFTRGRPRLGVAPPVAAPQEPPRPYLGFDAQAVTAELAKQLKLRLEAGLLVTAVRDGAPAQVGGLKKDDLVVKVDGADVTSKNALATAIGKKKPGDAVLLALLRDGKQMELKITLGRR
jgi:outer membrane murein-binding lipoprotein Lpp